MACFPAHLPRVTLENKMFCCCIPIFRICGLKKAQSEKPLCHCRHQLSPHLRSCWSFGRRRSQVTQGSSGQPTGEHATTLILPRAGLHLLPLVCVCVCVCVRERERDQGRGQRTRAMPFMSRSKMSGVESLAHLSCSYPRSWQAGDDNCWGPSSTTYMLITSPRVSSGFLLAGCLYSFPS